MIMILNVLFEKNIIRPKEEINDFMKNNRLRQKINEIKLKKEKKEEVLKKFKNFIELQKNIEENKKLKLINKSIRAKNSPLQKVIKIEENKTNDNNKKSINEYTLSQNTSVSTTLNLQEFYLSIYDAQKIFASKENDRRKLVKNYSMIINNNPNKNIFNINKENFENNKNYNYRNHNIISNKNNIINIDNNNNNSSNNKIKENKKFDKNAIKKIKKVINRLNNFIDIGKAKTTYNKTNYIKDKKYLINDYDYILRNVSKYLKRKLKSKSKNGKEETKKVKNKSNGLIIKKQIPVNSRNFKKISMNEIKKILNYSQNNIRLNINKHKLNKSNDNITNDSLSKEKKPFRMLIKNYSGMINKNKKYKFTDEQLNKYKEIFNYFFIYMKLFIQKKIFNIIVLYINIKNNYISGINKIIIFIKKKPFNYLRIIQQREYYQVILRQFYLPYLIRAFNNIKLYVINKQKYENANHIIKQVYCTIFIKRLLFFIELKENYMKKNVQFEKIIEEEKDDVSDSNENKEIKINNNKFKNSFKENSINSANYESDNNNHYIPKENENENELVSIQDKNVVNINEDSLNKDNSESYDEIKVITNTFNTIINNISLSPKIYIFNLLKKYYDESKNKKSINDKENGNMNNTKDNKKEIEKKEKDEKLNTPKNLDLNENKYNSYLYESLTEKSSISAFPNSEGNDRLHQVLTFLEQNKNANNNNSLQTDKNNNIIIQNKNNNFQIEKIDHQKQISNLEVDNNEENEEIIYYSNKSMNDSDGDKQENRVIKDKINFLNVNRKKEEMSLFIPYKGEIKKNLMSNLKNINSNNNNEYKEDISEDIDLSDNILKNEFKKYEQNKNMNNINDKKENNSSNSNHDIEKNQNIKNEEIIDNNNNASSEEIIFPIKNNPYLNLNNNQAGKIQNNSEKVENNKDINSLYFNLKNNFGFNVKNKINRINKRNKRYIENYDLQNSDINEEDKKILMNIPSDIEKKITEELTNEILNDLFKKEIECKENLLTYKKDSKRPSNSSLSAAVNKDSMSQISHSPGRKYNNKSHSSLNLVNNNESYSSVNSNKNNNILDEEELNNSIFKKTVYEIKKDIEIKYYEKNIFPKLLIIIENNIKKNYLNIINNLKEPLKKNDIEVMEGISNLITYDTIYSDNLIKYNSNFYNKDIDKKEFIDKNIIDEFNEQLRNKLIFFNKYNYECLNKCIYDATNEIIKEKRMYEDSGEPLLWSMRNRKIEYEYKNTKLFKTLFTSKIIEELKKLFFSKIGEIIENNENLNVSQFSKERDIKYNQKIREELKKEKELEKLDEQETIIKIAISKNIMNQLLNEVIEILEHIQYSRNQPEKYNYKSIFSCDNIPLLSFQKSSNETEEYEKSEDKINI